MLDDPLPIDDSFPDEQLAVINASRTAPLYADYANYIVAKFIPPSFTYQQKKKFFYDLRHYFWDDPHLYKEGVDGVIRRCVPKHEQEQILRKCHSEAYGGHHDGVRTTHKVLQSVFYGLLFSKKLVSLYYLVMNVKELVILVGIRKCL